MKKSIIALSCLALVLGSCGKEKDEEASEITPTLANLSGTYKITAATENNNNVFDNRDESLNYFDACERDDMYTLNVNLSYETKDAGTVCSPTSADMGTWSLLNATTIEIDDNVGTIAFFNGSKLIITESFGSFNYSATYIKQ